MLSASLNKTFLSLLLSICRFVYVSAMLEKEVKVFRRESNGALTLAQVSVNRHDVFLFLTKMLSFVYRSVCFCLDGVLGFFYFIFKCMKPVSEKHGFRFCLRMLILIQV